MTQLHTLKCDFSYNSSHTQVSGGKLDEISRISIIFPVHSCDAEGNSVGSEGILLVVGIML